MFSKSRSSSTPPASAGSAPAAPSGADAKRSATRPQAPSIVSGSLSIAGDLDSSGDIQVDGAVEGDIRTQEVTIGETGVVGGAVIADRVRVAGTVTGEITGREVALEATARVTGDIHHDSLSVEAGAHIEGLCRRVDDAAERVAAARERRATQAPAAGPAESPAADGVSEGDGGTASRADGTAPAGAPRAE